jgi:hypothetical protein
VEAGWRELRDSALDLGIPWNDEVTVRTAAHDVARSFGRQDVEDDALARGAYRGADADPEATAALHRLLLLIERARYSRSLPHDAVTEEQVRSDVAACVAAMRAGAGSRRRTRAVWLPASLSSDLATASRRRRSGGSVLADAGVDRAV